MKTVTKISNIIREVNETLLTDSHELDSSQRNALMLVHLITNVEEMVNNIHHLQGLVDDHKARYELLEHRVKVLEDNSIVNMMRILLKFMKDNPKLAIGLIIAALMSIGAAPELVKLIAVMAGLSVP